MTGERTRADDGRRRDVQFLHLHVHHLLARIVLFFLVVVHPPEKTRVPLVPRVLASDLRVGERLVLVLPQPSPSAHTGFPKPALGKGGKQTFNLLFSFWSSLQSFSNFSFSDTVLLSSFLLLSLSFCSWSPRFLFLMLSRSCRFISDRRSEHRFVRCSIFWMSLILDVWVCSSRFAFLTSRSATQSATKLDIKPPAHDTDASRAMSDSPCPCSGPRSQESVRLANPHTTWGRAPTDFSLLVLLAGRIQLELRYSLRNQLGRLGRLRGLLLLPLLAGNRGGRRRGLSVVMAGHWMPRVGRVGGRLIRSPVRHGSRRSGQNSRGSHRGVGHGHWERCRLGGGAAVSSDLGGATEICRSVPLLLFSLERGGHVQWYWREH